MEKNVIIAFALSLLVIVAFSSLQPRQEPPAREERRLPAPSTTGMELVSPDREEPRSAPPSGRQVVVETRLYRAVIDPLGARLVSFGLRNFTRAGEEYLETIGEKSVYPLEAGGFETVLYAPDRESLSLLPPGPGRGTVTFRCPEGNAPARKFSFDNDRYGFDLEISDLPQGTRKSTLVAFGPGEKTATSRSRLAPADRQQPEEVVIARPDGTVERVRDGSMREANRRFSSPDFIARKGQYLLKYLRPERTGPDATLAADGEGGISALYDLDLEPGETARFEFYSGPADHAILAAEAAAVAARMPSGPMVAASRLILRLLTVFHRLVPNWGVAIILLTIFFKVLFFPLTSSGLRTMKTMQKIQPMLKDLQEKHRGNPEALKKEMFSIYSHYKVNPMGGCLPMILQVPVFIGFFVMLRSAIVLRGAPFALWINDLSLPDRLLAFPDSWGLPENFAALNLLPFLMGTTMFFQQKLSGQVSGGAMRPEQKKMMLYMLPVMMTVFLYGLPSGLILYWTTSNLLSIAENRIATRHMK